MKTISSFNFSEIINDIKSGKIDSLCIVTSELYEDDEYDPEIIEVNETYFAGTTADEARACINAVEDDTHPDEYEMIMLNALQLHVSAEDFADYDEECDDAEEFIGNFVDEHSVEADNLGTSDWNVRSVRYEYESMQDGIVIYWSWDREIGYARTFKSLEYCIENINTLRCKPVDQVFSTQCSLLVSPSEVKDCKKASELRDLIQQRFDDMKLWRNDCKVDEFMRDLYADAEIYGSIYNLPDNDIYQNEEEDDE